MTDITSPEMDTHAKGLDAALRMKQLVYRPNPNPHIQRTVPYCSCNNRNCPICYPINNSTRAPGW